jgi:hypothetical protein
LQNFPYWKKNCSWRSSNSPFNLTGYLEVDSKQFQRKLPLQYFWFNSGYEAGQYSAGAFGKVLGSIFNPADMLYNFFGKNPKELKVKEMKKRYSV